jgi:hypothetical protein
MLHAAVKRSKIPTFEQATIGNAANAYLHPITDEAVDATVSALLQPLPQRYFMKPIMSLERSI